LKRKRLIRIVAGLFIAMILAGVLCLDVVDYRPYFKQPYYTQTIERLKTQLSTNAPTKGVLEAGFGEARLTPTLNAPTTDGSKGEFRSLPLAGYGNRHGKPARGTHDDLFVKAVALRVGDRLGVMLGCDALIVPREVTDLAMERLSRDAGLRREQVYLSATHTHGSIGGWGEGLVAEAFAGGYEPAARVWFADRIVTATKLAIADLQPASVGQGSFEARDFIRNRLIGKLGKVDPEFSFVLLKQHNGRTGMMGSFSAHATILSGDMMQFSADYPGAWQRSVETSNGGFAMFLGGGVGSHSPAAGEPGLKGVERMGKILAERSLAALGKITFTNIITFDFLGLEVTMPPLGPRLTDGIRLRPWLARKLLPARQDSYLQGFRLQNVMWMSTPCDYSGELALGIKDALRARGSRAVVTSFNGDYVGYVIPLKYYHLNGYEPRVMSFFGPFVPDYLDELVRTIALDLAAK
jgi:neutral ceramidase